MLFGAMVTPRVSDWMLIKDIENMGFGSVWMPDSHMIYSDTYTVLSVSYTHLTLPTNREV